MRSFGGLPSIGAENILQRRCRRADFASKRSQEGYRYPEHQQADQKPGES
jgi:hypothetical protein